MEEGLLAMGATAVGVVARVGVEAAVTGQLIAAMDSNRWHSGGVLKMPDNFSDRTTSE